MKEHGALCAEVVSAEELGDLLENVQSLHILDDCHLTLGLGEACDDACGLEGGVLPVDARVLLG